MLSISAWVAPSERIFAISSLKPAKQYWLDYLQQMAPIHLVFPLTVLNINALGSDELRRKGTTTEEAYCHVEAP